MATDVERLVVSLEASITKYERAMQRALGQTNATARRIESRFERMNRGLGNSFVSLQRNIALAFAGVAATRGAVQLVDAAMRIQNALKVTGLEGAELTRVYNRLYDSAQRNMAPVETLATLYSRLGLAQSQLGVTNEELLQFTDKVALALRVQGTNAQEARGALIQLSQAMGSGIVRAEEFNSVVEGAPSILRATAAGLEEAGGSVAKLRTLVIEGQVSSQAFFRAFQAGSVILEEQVANAEVTVSQQFIRLQNVLVDTAAKFDSTTGAGKILGDGIADLASEIQDFGTWLDQNGSGIEEFFTNVGNAIDAVKNGARDLGQATGLSGVGRWVEDITGLEVSIDYAEGGFTRLERAALAADARVADAEAAVRAFVNTFLEAGEVHGFSEPIQAEFREIIEQLNTGTLDAEDTLAALQALGNANPDFSNVLSGLADVIAQLQTVRAEALATASAMPGGPSSRGRPGKEPGQSVVNPDGSPIPPPRPSGLGDGSIETVSLADYPITPGGGGSSSGGGGGSNPTEQFEQALEQQRRRIENLREETALQATLSPLVNDYGYAMERLKVQQDLLNQAEQAGLELTPERVAAIDEVATAYANAQVEAAKLAEAQEFARDAMQNFADTAESALSGFINDLFEGKSAAEALGNALKNIGTSLLNFGLNAAFGAIFPFAEGGIAAHGRPQPLRKFARGGISNTAAIFGEGPMAEAAVPLPDGRRIPVDLRMPEMPKAAAANQAPIPIEIFVSPTGEFDARVGQIASQRASVIVAQGIKQNNKNLPALMQDMQMRQG